MMQISMPHWHHLRHIDRRCRWTKCRAGRKKASSVVFFFFSKMLLAFLAVLQHQKPPSQIQLVWIQTEMVVLLWYNSILLLPTRTSSSVSSPSPHDGLVSIGFGSSLLLIVAAAKSFKQAPLPVPERSPRKYAFFFSNVSLSYSTQLLHLHQPWGKKIK